MRHVPVLPHEVIEILNPEPGDFIIDATCGEGGHAKEIIKRITPGGIFLGIDWDKKQVRQAQKNIKTKEHKNIKVILKQGNYKDIKEIQKKAGLPKAGGLLLDLGFSSEHLESGRGFTFQKDEPLDMRYAEEGETAAEVVNSYPEGTLAEILWKYGEEKQARRIAKAIVESRKRERIMTTGQLVSAASRSGTRLKIHPATRTFQALRIYVNKELENLTLVLKDIPEILRPGGRAAVVSFHSIEDRIVKHYFKTYEEKGIAKRIHKKVIKPSREEVLVNPRSRSAKLRGLTIS